MGKPVIGDVVVVPFPFSDLSNTKRRPALVVADLNGDDFILCMITSREVRDRFAIALDSGDFDWGGLEYPSNIRPSRLLTVDASIMVKVAGHLTSAKLAEVREKLRAILEVPSN